MQVTDDGGAAVRLGGRPLVWHQLQAALALGCERIVCLAQSPGSVLAGLQHAAEGRDAKFHAIAHCRALSGLVSVADTLFVFAPGVLPDREWLVHTLGARAGIAVLPADGAVERGFERIDRERAWGGVLVTRGDAVEVLASLPPDSDPIAGLLRVALQRGGRCVEIPPPWLDDGRWALLTDGALARRVEESWQARHVPAPALARPGEALAHRLARALLPRVADQAMFAPGLAIGGTALAVAGGGAGFAGYTPGGLAALTIGTLLALAGERLGRFARAGSGDAAPTRLAAGRDALFDLALIGVAASPEQFAGWTVPFVATVLVAAIRLAREDEAPPAIRPLGDRALVFGLLAAAAAAGGFAPAAATIGLLALAGRLFSRPGRG